MDSRIDKLNNVVIGHIFPTTEDNLNVIIIQHDRGRIANGLATVSALMCDFLAALSTRFKHHPTVSVSYHWIHVHEGHFLKCEPHAPLQKLDSSQGCRSISFSQTQGVSFIGFGRGSTSTIPGYAFNTGEALKLHRSSNRLVLYAKAESYEGIEAVCFYFIDLDITIWQQAFDPSGVHQETKCSLFRDNDDYKATQLQCNAIGSAQQALLSGYFDDGQASIWHCDEFPMLSRTTKVKCLSDDGCWITLSLLDVPISHDWIVVDHDSVTAFDLISDITLMVTKDYICESFSMVQANTNAHVLSLEFPILNLEDKVLIEAGGIIMNVVNIWEGMDGNLETYLWDPG